MPTLYQHWPNGGCVTCFLWGEPIGHRLNKQSSWVTSDLRHQCDRRQCNIHMSKDVTVLFRRCTDWSKHNVQKDNGLLLAGAKPLIWTNAGIYCQLDPCKQTSLKFNRNSYICKKMHLKMSSGKRTIILSGPQWVNMNQVFVLVYCRSVTMPKTGPELIAASSIGTISAQSSSGKLWSEKNYKGTCVGPTLGRYRPCDVGPTSLRRWVDVARRRQPNIGSTSVTIL